jgi:hypothetical protein
VVKRMSRNRYRLLAAVCPVGQAVLRLEPCQAVLQSLDSPELKV